ncbi:MAG: tRNA (adenosine(37)-N6)-threonylcarbamoyltransferase complex ATPase subunit type 1 TsaE [Sediminibacterium sp.]|nr:tRNA (adenosine(37)-N6)-threonylcarbamoyltransferase complex ATPase subunit type 1 TsaE [Sediminibacterium sp.]
MKKTEQYIFTAAELEATCHSLLSVLPAPSIVLLEGQMGAGKTTLVKQICQLLGVTDGISSPTYSIVNEYQGKDHLIFHFDLYRLKDVQELMDMGFEDYLYQNAWVFIEWPELAEPFLPDQYVHLNLAVDGEQRVLSLTL